MDLKKIWIARKQILEGVTNTVFKKKFVEDIAKDRLEICKTCKYGYYNGKCEVPGTEPCCHACGCSLKYKTRSLSSPCGATVRGEEPLWLPILKQEDEDKHFSDIWPD